MPMHWDGGLKFKQIVVVGLKGTEKFQIYRAAPADENFWKARIYPDCADATRESLHKVCLGDPNGSGTGKNWLVEKTNREVSDDHCYIVELEVDNIQDFLPKKVTWEYYCLGGKISRKLWQDRMRKLEERRNRNGRGLDQKAGQGEKAEGPNFCGNCFEIRSTRKFCDTCRSRLLPLEEPWGRQEAWQERPFARSTQSFEVSRKQPPERPVQKRQRPQRPWQAGQAPVVASGSSPTAASSSEAGTPAPEPLEETLDGRWRNLKSGEYVATISGWSLRAPRIMWSGGPSVWMPLKRQSERSIAYTNDKALLSAEQNEEGHLLWNDGTIWARIGNADEETADIDFPSREDWESMRDNCKGDLQAEHARLPREERLLRSWARCLAFAQVSLGVQGKVGVRKGTVDRPFQIWVFGGENVMQEEVDLAQRGYFADTNFVDRTPTEVVIFGDAFGSLTRAGADQEEAPGSFTWTSQTYAGVDQRLEYFGKPDLVALFHPRKRFLAVSPHAKHAFDVVGRANVPVVISIRRTLSAGEMDSLSIKLHNAEDFKAPAFLLPDCQTVCPLRCPFSAAGVRDCGLPFLSFTADARDPDPRRSCDDNGWILAVRGMVEGISALGCVQDFLADLIDTDSTSVITEPEDKIRPVSWGIVDIKYDPRRPIGDRMKVLETGDGSISKMSLDGKDVHERLESRYHTSNTENSKKYQLVTKDKLLTHLYMEDNQCGFIVPKQAFFGRHYDDGLANRIIERLKIGDDKCAEVVLKLCNLSRSCGVIRVRKQDLDKKLKQLLEPKSDHDLETWFKEGLEIEESDKFGPGEVVDGKGSEDETQRHWWANECPIFVAESFCSSMPVTATNRDESELYDGTLRVLFAMSRRRPRRAPGPSEPSDLEVEFCGGYWKLPKETRSSDNLQLSFISDAKTKTATVQPEDLHEVCAQLSDSLQCLFGGESPTAKQLVRLAGKSGFDDQDLEKDLEAYFTAKLLMQGLPSPYSDSAFASDSADLASAATGRSKQVLSFIHRCRGCLELKMAVKTKAKVLKAEEHQKKALEHFERAVQVWPTNANALFFRGYAAFWWDDHCQRKPSLEAIKDLRRSRLLDPDFRQPLKNLGIAYIQLGQYQKAIDVSKAFMKRHSSGSALNLGAAYYHLALELHRDLKLNARWLQTWDEDEKREDLVKTFADARFYLLMASNEEAQAKEAELSSFSESELGRFIHKAVQSKGRATDLWEPPEPSLRPGYVSWRC